MWPLVMAAIRRYVPIVTFPVALIVGFIGYQLESKFSNKYTPSTPSISQQRLERTLETVTSSETDMNKKIKHNPLETNLSPSLQA